MIVSYPMLCTIQSDPFTYMNEINVILESFKEFNNIQNIKVDDIIELMVIYKVILKTNNTPLILKMESIIDKLSKSILNGGLRDIKNFTLSDLINPTAIGVFN